MAEYGELPRSLVVQYDELKNIYRNRDGRHRVVADGRAGEIQKVLPGVFPDTWPKPIVANAIEDAAGEMADALAPLPAVDCLPGKAGSQRAKEFAAKRTKIALGYMHMSRLRHQMQAGADWFNTFAAMPIVVEANIPEKLPCMRVDNPRGAYWHTDSYGQVTLYVKEWQETCGSLCARFPELAGRIRTKYETTNELGERVVGESSPNETLTVVRMYTDERTYMWLPERGNLVIASAKNFLGRVPVEIAELPRWDDESRGTFDQVLWVWLAHNRMSLLNMEAVKKAVQAPIVAGDDVQKIPVGPDAVLRAREPEKIKRLGLDLPQSSFLESQVLQSEIDRSSARRPSMSNFDASIVTGRGVQELGGVFSSAIKSGQDEIGEALRRALMMCFELDEILWPGDQKTVEGMSNGAPFTETYVPSRDIKQNYSVSVSYGFTAGMDPNRALVWLLQLRGDRAISRETMMRALPMETDVEGETRNINLERLDDAALAGVEGLSAQLPQLALAGQVDITPSLQAIAKMRKLVKSGTPTGEAMEEAFTPPEPQGPSPEELMAQAMAGGGGPPGAEGAPAEAGPGGGPGVAPTPDSMQMLLAGLTNSGAANLQSNVSRFIPA